MLQATMDALTAIMTRRSVRSFTEEDVTAEQIETLLRAAMAAPSAGNAQPWTFVVMRDKAILNQIPALNQYAAFAAKSPLAILICGNLQAEKFAGFWPQDTAAAMENLLLAAHALGLGAVWTGIYPIEERVAGFRALINAPEHIVPMGLAVIGHPTSEPKPVDRYQEALVHHNVW